MLPGPLKQKRPPGKTPFRRYDATTGLFTGVGAMAEATTHLTPYQFGANSPVMYNDPTGLLVSGAGYVARPGLQRGVDGYYKAPWEAEFEWNDEGFFDWYNHGVGGGNYSSINGITTKQVLSKKRPGEKLDFYRGEFGFWQPFTGHSNNVSETGLQDVVVGTRFVSWDNAHEMNTMSGWDKAMIGVGAFGVYTTTTQEIIDYGVRTSYKSFSFVF